MLILTPSQREFIAHHNINEHEILDAHGMRPKNYKTLMSKMGYRLAIGVSACKKEGHTMRSANGACAMRRPANLNYRKRYRESGYVYVATTTDRSDIIKVGYTNNVADRKSTLNGERYAGYKNWHICFSLKVAQKGPVEDAVHKKLAAHAFTATYVTHNKNQMAKELFKCSPENAIAILKKSDSNDSPLTSQTYNLVEKPLIIKNTTPELCPKSYRKTQQPDTHIQVNITQNKTEIKKEKLTPNSKGKFESILKQRKPPIVSSNTKPTIDLSKNEVKEDGSDIFSVLFAFILFILPLLLLAYFLFNAGLDKLPKGWPQILTMVAYYFIVYLFVILFFSHCKVKQGSWLENLTIIITFPFSFLIGLGFMLVPIFLLIGVVDLIFSIF